MHHASFRDLRFADASRYHARTRSSLAKPLTLAAMSLGYGVVQLDVTIVNTALNSIGSALGGGVAELQWVVSTYTIAFAALILTAGALGDRLGAKSIFMAGFAMFTAASLACALAPTAAILIAARAAQGVGAAILVPNSLALLNHAYPEEKERGRAVGDVGGRRKSCATAGPFVGGALITLVGWRSIFLVNLPIGLSACGWLGATRPIRRARRTSSICPARSQPSSRSALLAAAIIEGGRVGWSNALGARGLRRVRRLRRLVHHSGAPRARSRCCRCRCSRIACSR